MSYITKEESQVSKFFFSNTKMAWFWLVVRVYVGWVWLEAGLEKFSNPAWVGDNAGVAMGGFIKGALAKTTGLHPDVSMWYASFLQNVVTPNVSVWSYMITYGEILVGIGLILGAFTGLAAFFGFFMNMNFLLAGTVSTNPVLLVLSIGLILARNIAGYFGADRYVIPKLRVLWRKRSQ